MAYASENLIDEHEGILFGLMILEKMVELLNTDGSVDTDDIKNMINFFQSFADKCHHGKEESMLFPEMEKAGIPNKNGPIGQMLIEHAAGRKYIAQMADSLGKYIDQKMFTAAASEYINLLRNHIKKENNVLFPMGDKKIPENMQKKLLESFETYEIEVMGEGTHKHFHELLHHLDKKYKPL